MTCGSSVIGGRGGLVAQLGDIADGPDECFRGLLRQVVPRAGHPAVQPRTGEPVRVGQSLDHGEVAVGLAFESDGRDADRRAPCQGALQLVVRRVPGCRAEPVTGPGPIRP